MYNIKNKNTITVTNSYGEEISMSIDEDTTLEKRHKTFLIILQWLTFYKPEEDLLLTGTEEFYDALNNIDKPIMKDSEE